ncbi:MAG: hypothetical protein COA82_04590 [Alkaliphilus sp.]|nr:hypothetical protein [bacterium AH-315-L21]MBN4062611.1 hypothetical protein [Alkaliphilus sp. AH-315-G20]PHS35342.1 MAG: hypothetical protein COA82_04590 [Alkaliphilus sp.]
MKEVIATLIISVVILGLLMIGINLWRGNIDIMRLAAEQTHEMEKVGEVDFISLQKDSLYGSEVISIIRYFSKDSSVQINVLIAGNERSFKLETYDSPVYNIPFEMKFEKEILYENNKIVEVNFSELK